VTQLLFFGGGDEVKAFVESGLKDLSISRTSIRWGIPFPGAPGRPAARGGPFSRRLRVP